MSPRIQAVIARHKPKVEKGSQFWWSKCITCGHAEHYITWRRAYIDALIHSDRLK